VKILYFFAYSILMIFVWFRLGEWYGHEKAVVEMQESRPILNYFEGSQAEFYTQYVLKQCLMQLKEKEAGESAPMKPVKVTQGKASYYSTTGCLGCSKNLTMANGETLDDTKLTVAYNRAPLNSYVKIKNLDNQKEVTAKVTDTGGFEKYGKIIDLGLAVKNILACGSTCNVQVTEL